MIDQPWGLGPEFSQNTWGMPVTTIDPTIPILSNVNPIHNDIVNLAGNGELPVSIIPDLDMLLSNPEPNQGMIDLDPIVPDVSENIQHSVSLGLEFNDMTPILDVSESLLSNFEESIMDKSKSEKKVKLDTLPNDVQDFNLNNKEYDEVSPSPYGYKNRRLRSDADYPFFAKAHTGKGRKYFSPLRKILRIRFHRSPLGLIKCCPICGKIIYTGSCPFCETLGRCRYCLKPLKDGECMNESCTQSKTPRCPDCGELYPCNCGFGR